jgi:predicted nucleic acid-binding protein
MSWADTFEVVDSRWPSFEAAFSLSAEHGLRTWDALILAVAASAAAVSS